MCSIFIPFLNYTLIFCDVLQCSLGPGAWAGAEPEPLRPLDKPLGKKPAESMSPETQRELGFDNVRLGEQPVDPRDDRTEQPR